MTLLAPKNTTLDFPGTTTPAIPILIDNPNWDTFGPVAINFVPASNPDPASPDPIGRFMVSLSTANGTGLNGELGNPWRGFRFVIIDDNNTDYPSQKTGFGGTLLHPDRAHFHTDKIRPETLFFTDDISIEQTFYNSKGVLTTRQKDIADGQGVYTMTLTNKSDFIDPLTRYNPFFYDDNPGVRSLLDVHLQRVSREAMRRAMFTLILQAIPGGQ